MLEETLKPIRQIQNQYFTMFDSIRQVQETFNSIFTSYQYQLMNESITQIVNSVNEITHEFSIPCEQLTENLLHNLRDALSDING